MMNNFDDILLELGYRVPEGIVNLTKDHQVTELVNILRENGYENANELAQKARVYFSYLKEIDDAKRRVKVPIETIMNQTVTNTDTKKKIKVSSALQYKNSDNAGQQSAYQQAQAMFKDAGYDDSEITKISGDSKPEQPTPQGPNAFGVSGGGQQVFGSGQGKKPEEIKKEIDRISIDSGQSREGFYKKGYHKSEGEDDAGAAPGNAGSMLNENGSCDVCEWALENDSDDLVEAVKHLYGNLKGGALLDATDKTGIAGQEDRVPSVTAGQLKAFREAGKGAFNK